MVSSEDDPVYIVKFKQTFTLDMEKCKEKTSSTWLKISTALDPRFKDLKCLHRSERDEVWALIAGIMREEMLAQEPVQTVTSEPPQKKAALLVASESESDEDEACIEKYLERYRAEPVISMEDYPLEWWSKHAGSHPKLACLARSKITKRPRIQEICPQHPAHPSAVITVLYPSTKENLLSNYAQYSSTGWTAEQRCSGG
ncbi:hypothetical protein SRHO_G00098190 [Serrasalmus rhombeus]